MILKGNYIGKRECYIMPDWLLIYRIEGKTLMLYRTGTHFDLFRNLKIAADIKMAAIFLQMDNIWKILTKKCLTEAITKWYDIVR